MSNPPPLNTPPSLQKDPQTASFIQQLSRAVYQMWTGDLANKINVPGIGKFNNPTATSTNFHKQLEIGSLTIWESDGATANGNLSGIEGDICLNGGTGTGQAAYCTGTTNWTDM